MLLNQAEDKIKKNQKLITLIQGRIAQAIGVQTFEEAKDMLKPLANKKTEIQVLLTYLESDGAA